jgi:hypothetical protein
MFSQLWISLQPTAMVNSVDVMKQLMSTLQLNWAHLTIRTSIHFRRASSRR